MSPSSSHLHVCCVALGTRGDVQPVACIALYLEKRFKKTSTSFITHGAHSSWLESSIYASLTRKEYVASPPAGGCWAAADAAAAVPPAVGGGRSQPSLVQPESQVVEAICNRILAADAMLAEGTADAEEQSAGYLHPRLKPLRQRLRYLRRRLAEQDEKYEQELRRQQQPQHCEQQQQQQEQQQQLQRHVILFNLFALEAYHAAEALGLRCAVAAPYMIPYRCPTAFINMFRHELPELFNTLCQAAELQQEVVAGVPGLETAALPSAGLERRRLRPHRVTFAEVTHWMWPLFTERWGEWRSAVLGLPPLPLHRRRRDHRSPEAARKLVLGGQRPGSASDNDDDDSNDNDEFDGTGRSAGAAAAADDDDGHYEPLPLDSLPAAPLLLYGFSDLFLPRHAYWPRSVYVCGFWQPPVEWFAGQQLPGELVTLLTDPVAATRASVAEAAEPEANSAAPSCTTDSEIPQVAAPTLFPPRPPQQPPPPGSSRWCLVDFGSSGRLGLIPSPFATLERLDRVLQDLGMNALVLSGGWLPLHQAAEELRNRHPHHGQHHDYQDGREGAAGSVADDEERRAAATTAAAARGPPAPAPAAAGVHDLGKETPTEACTGVDDGGGSGEDDDDDDDATAAGASMGLEVGAEAGYASSRLRRRRTRDVEGEGEPPDPEGRAVRMRRAGTGRDGRDDAPVEAASPRLYLYGGDVAHQLILPYCRLVLHHGGSGTIAAAMQCGVPQIICPLHFDQPFGGYRVAHLGLSPPTLDRDVLFGSSSDFVGWDDALGAPRGGNLDDDDPRVGILTSTFRCALQADKLQAARRMAQDLAEEGSGLSVAAAALLRAAYNGI